MVKTKSKGPARRGDSFLYNFCGKGHGAVDLYGAPLWAANMAVARRKEGAEKMGRTASAPGDADAAYAEQAAKDRSGLSGRIELADRYPDLASYAKQFGHAHRAEL